MFKSLINVRKMAAAVIAASLLSAGSAKAEDPDLFRFSGGTPSGQATQAIAPVAAPSVQPAPRGGLTHESLVQMLTNLGYEVKTQRNDRGEPYHVVTIESGKWEFGLSICLSASGTYLWVNSAVAQLPADLKDVPQEKLVAMLQKNFELGPSSFNYRAQSRRIYFSAPMQNRDVTPKALRAHIEEVCRDIQNNEAIWNTKTWSTGSAGAPALSSNLPPASR